MISDQARTLKKHDAMISRNEAEAIIKANITPTPDTEQAPLTEAYGRTVAVDVTTDIAAPPFNRVTMDGYAVIAADGPGEYEVVEYVPAGFLPQVTVTPGKVSRVMTGAPLPAGADAVVQVEKTGGYVEVGEKAEIKAAIKSGGNVSPVGEDMKPGDLVLSAGATLGPAEIAVIAGAGADPVTVYRRPTVGILSTGDELVAPDQIPGPGQIRNSNACSVYAQASAAGGLPTLLGVASDEGPDLAEKISRGKSFDFLLVSGGVSAGDKDLVPATLAEAGYDILIHKVKIKPGKPMLFCKGADNRYAFGLPGNPVSTFVIFELFIKPAIALFSGSKSTGPDRIKAKLSQPFKRKSGEREEYIPVWLIWDGSCYRAALTGYHGSGHIHALTNANGLFMAPIGETDLPEGYVSDAIFFR